MNKNTGITLGIVLLLSGLLMAVPCRAFWLGGSSSTSRWVDKPIIIDGAASDWIIDDGTEDSGFTFAFSNDDENIYFLISPKTNSTKFLLAAAFDQDFTIWVDTGAHKKKNIGLKLVSARLKRDAEHRGGRTGAGVDMPSEDAPGSMRQGEPDADSSVMFNRPEGSMWSGGKGGIRTSTGTLKLIGIDTAAVQALPEDTGLALKIGDVSARGVLEARIPISLLGGGLPKKITFGFEASALPAPHDGAGSDGKDSGRRPAGGRGPGGASSMGGVGGPPPGGGGMGGAGGPPPGGGQMGAGTRGSMGGPNGNSGTSDAEDTGPLDVWVRVTLANQPKVSDD